MIFFMAVPLVLGQAVNPVLNIREVDGTPSTYPYQIKFTNGTVTDNADGTVSVSVTGGSGSSSGTTVYIYEAGATVSSATTMTLDFDGGDFDITDTGDGTTDLIDITVAAGLDEICENNGSTDVAIDITATNATTTPLTITGASSQEVKLFEIEDDSSDTLFRIWHTGHMQNIDGWVTTSPQYGPAIWVHDYGDSTPEHTNMTGSYDHTGGAEEQIFTRTAGDTFAQADADNRNFILLTGTNLGASAEIKEYVDANNVIVSGMGWDGDLASQTFVIYKHPAYFTGDSYKHEFSVDGAGEFEVVGYSFTGSKMAKFENDIDADRSDSIHIEHNANGKNNTDAMQVFYRTGAIQTGDEMQVVQITIDDTGATDGEVDGLLIETVDAVAGVEKHAIHVGVGFDNAFRVSGATADDMDYGYTYTAGASPTSKTTAFITSDTGGANNIEVFSAADDYILIGNDVQFEVLSVVLETGSSKDLDLEFYYSNNTNGSDIGVAGWTEFDPDDSTEDFQQSGIIDWTAWGADWDEDDQAEAGEAISDGYYIAIKRTRTGDPPTDAVEDKFQIYLSQSTGMNIDGLGVIQHPYLGAAPTGYEVNGKMWMESDGLHVYYNGGEETLSPSGAFDATAVDDVTWSDADNAVNTWTFDLSGTNTTMAFGSGLVTFSHDITVTGDDVNLGVDPADTGELNLSNGGIIAWEDATETTLTHVDDTGIACNLNIEGNTMTQGGQTMYDANDTPSGELGGTYSNITIDDSVAVASWNLTTPTITTSLTTDGKTISEAEIGRLDGLAGIIVTDVTACTDLEGTNLSITAGVLNASGGSGLWTDLTPNLEPNDDGDGIQINDGGGSDYVVQSHDGTDYNFVGTNTTQYTFDAPVEIAGSGLSLFGAGINIINSALAVYGEEQNNTELCFKDDNVTETLSALVNGQDHKALEVIHVNDEDIDIDCEILQVGKYNLTSIDLTILTDTNGANGLDTGSLGNATWYYAYVIYNPLTATKAGLASLSSTAPTMPTGYTEKRYVCSFRTDGTADIIDFHTNGGKWVYYDDNYQSHNGSSSSFTAVDASGLMPPSSTLFYGYGRSSDASSVADMSLRATGDTDRQSIVLGEASGATTSGDYSCFVQPTNSSQSYDYKIGADDTNGIVWITGYLDNNI